MIHSGIELETSLTAETELTAEWNQLVESQQKGPGCNSGNECEKAVWTLTLQAKQKEILRELAIVRSRQKPLWGALALTFAGTLFLLFFYSDGPGNWVRGLLPKKAEPNPLRQ
jgi:hypothetical protein